MTRYAFQGVWPILDAARTTAELVAEALPELELMAAEQRVALLGQPQHWVVPAEQMPGWGRHDGYVLVLRAPACPAAELVAERFGTAMDLRAELLGKGAA